MKKIIKLVLIVLILMVSIISYATDIAKVIKAGDVKKLEKLLDKNPELVKVIEKRGQALLHQAADLGKVKIAQLLIKRGAKIDSFYHQKNTPFTYAAYSGRIEVAKLLLSKGADLNYRNAVGETALIFAVRNRHTKFIDFLLDNGVKIDEDIRLKEIDIHLAAKAGNTRLMDLCLKKGMKLNIQKKTGNTFLHSVAIGGIGKYVKKTIDEGTEVNVKNYYGYTPLHAAIKAGKIDIVKILIKKGADFKIRTLSGETVNDLARKSGNKNLIKYFKTHHPEVEGFKFPVLTGKYIDRNLPGDTARLFAPGIISTFEGVEFAGTFTPDGKDYYFTRRVDGKQRIYWTTYKNKQWTKSEMAPPPLSFPGAHEYEPFISPDGNRMFFGSKRPLPGKKKLNHEYEIWYTNKTGKGWGQPEYFKGQIGYVTSALNGNIYYDFWIDFDHEKNGIYKQVRDGLGYKKPVKLNKIINGMKYAGHPFIAPDGSYLIFDSKVQKYVGDLFISFRKRDASWGIPINMGSEINGQGSVMTASVSPDGKMLFFYRNGDIYWISTDIINVLKKEWKKNN